MTRGGGIKKNIVSHLNFTQNQSDVLVGTFQELSKLENSELTMVSWDMAKPSQIVVVSLTSTTQQSAYVVPKMMPGSRANALQKKTKIPVVRSHDSCHVFCPANR